jgi:hypothetical protein
VTHTFSSAGTAQLSSATRNRRRHHHRRSRHHHHHHRSRRRHRRSRRRQRHGRKRARPGGRCRPRSHPACLRSTPRGPWVTVGLGQRILAAGPARIRGYSCAAISAIAEIGMRRGHPAASRISLKQENSSEHTPGQTFARDGGCRARRPRARPRPRPRQRPRLRACGLPSGRGAIQDGMDRLAAGRRFPIFG